uniref:Uncharacterized protein n=1 Tax=Knipowitschia caucasica TaxID=637954 RepID=A0AAV2JY30_KNICA
MGPSIIPSWGGWGCRGRLVAPCRPIITPNDAGVITYFILTSDIDWMSRGAMGGGAQPHRGAPQVIRSKMAPGGFIAHLPHGTRVCPPSAGQQLSDGPDGNFIPLILTDRGSKQVKAFVLPSKD